MARARKLQQLATDVSAVEVSDRLADDLDQHRHALAHLTARGDADRALSLVGRLELPLYVTGRWIEKVELFDAALAIPAQPSVAQCRALALRARPGPMHHFSLEHARAAEAMALELGHEALLAFALHLQSIGLFWRGQTGEAVALAADAADTFARLGRVAESAEARKFHGVALVLDGEAEQGLAVQRDALSVMREAVGPLAVAHSLSYLGHCHRFVGDDVAAEADWRESADLYRAVENRGTAIHVAIGLAEIATDREEPEAALGHVSEALDLCDAARLPTYAPWAWTAALRAHAIADDHDSALACARRAAPLLSATPTGEAVRLAYELAGVAVAIGGPESAGRLVGFAGATTDRRELPFPAVAERRRHAELVDRLTAAVPEAVDAGSRCTFTEAAGPLLRERGAASR